MNLRRMIGIAAATLGVAAIGVGVSPMSVSATQSECISTADKGEYSEIPYCDDFDYCDRIPAIAYAQNGDYVNGYDCEPDPCPYDQTLVVTDPNCRPTETTVTETTVTETTVTETTVTETTQPVEQPTTTEVDAAGPIPAPAPPAPSAPAVLPATGSSDLPLVLAGTVALLLGVGMVRFARSGAR
jgi:LPXTG-motif cell wall-anchored protein